jgi:hypothetical protein
MSSGDLQGLQASSHRACLRECLGESQSSGLAGLQKREAGWSQRTSEMEIGLDLDYEYLSCTRFQNTRRPNRGRLVCFFGNIT